MSPRLAVSAVLALTFAAVGCSRNAGMEIRIEGPKDLVGRKCAVVVGSMMGDMTLKVQPGIGIEWFNDYNSGIEAVRIGKIDAMPFDLFYARRWVQREPEAFAITRPYHSIPWGFFFAKGSPLRDRVDAVLKRMRASGDLDRIIAKWGEASDSGAVQFDRLDYRPDFTGKAGTLRFATPGDREPVTYTRADGIVGFDIDIVRRIAYELDMNLELVRITMGGLVPAVQGGKADMGGGGTAITEERAQQVDFSECYYNVPTVFLIRRASAADGVAEIRSVSDLEGRRCGIVTGTALQDVVDAVQKGVIYDAFNDSPSMVEALRLGKVDAVPLDTVVLRRWAANCPGEFKVVANFADNPYGYFFQKGSPLRQRVNAILAELKASGALKRIVSKWCDAPDMDGIVPEPFPHRKDYTGRKGRFRFATTGDYEPGSFVRNGELVGFDIDIAKWIACELDMEFEAANVTVSALVPAVQSGKADMGGGCITITASRAEVVDFSECYLNDGFSLMVKNPEGKPRGGIRTATDLKGKHVAHLSSDFHKKELLALEPDIVFDPYSEYAFAIESLRNGKIDAISLGRTYADIWMAQFPGEFRVAFEYADDVCCFLLSKNSPLRQKFDAELRKMNAAGETAAIARRWIDGAKSGKPPAMPEFPAPPNGAPDVRLACAAQAEPWCFVAGDKFGGLVGADIEIVRTVAQRLGWNLKPKVYSWGGMVDCVNAGRCEIASGGIYTAGRTFPTVDASEKYADEKMCLLVRNEEFKGGDSGLIAFAKSL